MAGRVYRGRRWLRPWWRERLAVALAWLALALLVMTGCGLAFGVYLAKWLGV